MNILSKSYMASMLRQYHPEDMVEDLDQEDIIQIMVEVITNHDHTKMRPINGAKTIHEVMIHIQRKQAGKKTTKRRKRKKRKRKRERKKNHRKKVNKPTTTTFIHIHIISNCDFP